MQVFHELTLAEFADAFAQMLAYGLFLARLNADVNTTITLANVRQHVPNSFRLIRELVSFLEELNNEEYAAIRWVVEEVLSIVNGLDLTAIHEDLSFRQRKAMNRSVRAKDEEEWRLFSRDPFVYFYEDFLAKYDAKMKKSRGVYYTPPPIVNFIVRAVDDILKDKFEIHDGLADHKQVTVLDFACGTGTFLLEAFQRIFENVGGSKSGRADLIVRDHILKNLFGFEYLIAPYTIAHLKLSQYLSDQGHPLKGSERLRIYLTNTLDPIHPEPNFLLPAVTEESEAAQAVKDRPILAIVGNPPYSGESKNKGEWIKAAIDGYKYTIEYDDAGRELKKKLGEKNSKWLNDDYVKFIRFAQLKMDVVEEGIVGIITNHSWLDNPTFRGMRQSLMRSFEQIYILDLHGNANKKEKAADGSKDENIFDIEQGVAISVFIKCRKLDRGVFRADVWGRRIEKYRFASSSSINEANFERIEVAGPDFLFVKQDADLREIYGRWVSVKDIFVEGGTGIITKRDSLAIQNTPEEMWQIVREFAELPPEDARTRFNLPPDVRDWSIRDAQADIAKDGPDENKIKRILYRPFDDRFTYYTGRARGFLGWPVERISRHFDHENVGLITSRLTKGEDFKHAQITDKMNEVIVMSSVTSNNGFTFPLWLYDGSGGKIENFASNFRSFIDRRFGQHFEPDEILGYIYGVLHAPVYRSTYKEFLQRGFPRIPFPNDVDKFELISQLGWALVQAHLLRGFPRVRLAQYHGKGDHSVDSIRYSEVERAVWINKEQSFRPIPEEVWTFHIGGYQVLEKYLKSRKGRTLTLDEIDHVSVVADSLAFTINQMARIDEAYRAAFPDGG